MKPAIIFDLDVCLARADEAGAQLYEPVFDAVRRANDGAVSDDDLERAFAESWRFPFDEVADRHRFTPAMRDAGFREFGRLEVTAPMRGYPDLHLLRTIPARRFLVTSGFRRLQESKVRALGIAGWFERVYIDAIDEPGPHGKEGVFRELLRAHELRADEVFVVGDNPDSEIAAGNRLGLTTVQILRPGVPRGPGAAHYVEGLAELDALVRRRGATP
ncbi:putative hydrolase of the HAD superfamily [Nannocystis exedens]|uniref:Putative hydrolase of the HAD superfamily n=1 Tax=Nannocystis exedens TaxID=54 RepID=A0A1I1UCP4_9BACT|nr:HAD family hydrolase [Nannocystis exedens]PCC71602.1 dUMP phosphatase [Nannocystis exedens]SFD68529.1 putative hydrolase of the HAD superfamily [Nannocystis exedens]